MEGLFDSLNSQNSSFKADSQNIFEEAHNKSVTDMTTEVTRKCNFSTRIQALPLMDVKAPYSIGHPRHRTLIDAQVTSITGHLEELFESENQQILDSFDRMSQSSQRNEENLAELESRIQKLGMLLMQRHRDV